MQRSMSLLAAGLLCFGVAGCEVDVQDAGQLPDVEVENGRMPEADVRGPEVETGEREVTVPTIEGVGTPEENEPEAE